MTATHSTQRRPLTKAEPLILFHANCSDGFCAAWIVHRVWPDAEFVPMSYGDIPPDVTGREVYILDFSFKRPIMQELIAKAKTLVCLDHHKTAQDDLDGLKADNATIVFDMVKSGARLTAEYFGRFSTDLQKPSWLVDYTEDRDLWRWNLPYSKEISAWLASHERSFDAWDHFENPGSKNFDSRVGEGSAILRYQQQTVDSQCEKATEIELDGHKVLCVNATTLISEIAGQLAENRPFGATYFIRGDGQKIWSLRSREGGVDVSEIAKRRGGGGHRNAAGFQEEVRQ